MCEACLVSWGGRERERSAPRTDAHRDSWYAARPRLDFSPQSTRSFVRDYDSIDLSDEESPLVSHNGYSPSRSRLDFTDRSRSPRLRFNPFISNHDDDSEMFTTRHRSYRDSVPDSSILSEYNPLRRHFVSEMMRDSRQVPDERRSISRSSGSRDNEINLIDSDDGSEIASESARQISGSGERNGDSNSSIGLLSLLTDESDEDSGEVTVDWISAVSDIEIDRNSPSPDHPSIANLVYMRGLATWRELSRSNAELGRAISDAVNRERDAIEFSNDRLMRLHQLLTGGNMDEENEEDDNEDDDTRDVVESRIDRFSRLQQAFRMSNDMDDENEEDDNEDDEDDEGNNDDEDYIDHDEIDEQDDTDEEHQDMCTHMDACTLKR